MKSNNVIRIHAGKTLAIQPGGDTALFYSDSPKEPWCIGHLRFDVDGCGKLWASWEPHSAARTHNRQPFRDEFDALVNALQRKLFCKPDQILKRLADMGVPVIEADRRYYGFHIDSDAYSYYFRVYPGRGDYSYCYCYAREGGGGNG